MSKNEKLHRKKNRALLILLVSFFFICISLFQLRKMVFQQCVEHVDNSPTHTHTQLTIIQDGKLISIPANIGNVEGCMHPLHTHDATGLIHMEYPLPFPFFLGDFFDVMGTKFDNGQIGAIRTFDGYTISVKKNGKKVHGQYRWILLRDLDKIEIDIKSKSH